MSSTEQVVMIDSDSDIECTGQRRVRLLRSNVQSRAIRTTSRPTSRILASSIIDLTADIDDLIPLPRSHASPDVSHIKPNPSLPKPPSSTRNAYNSPKGSPYTLSQPARKLRSSLSVRNANSRPHASNLPPNGPQLKVGGTLPNVSNPKPSPSIMKCGPPPKGAKREVSTKPVKPVQPVASSSKLPSVPATEFITIDSSDDESEEEYSAFDIDNGSVWNIQIPEASDQNQQLSIPDYDLEMNLAIGAVQDTVHEALKANTLLEHRNIRPAYAQRSVWVAKHLPPYGGHPSLVRHLKPMISHPRITTIPSYPTVQAVGYPTCRSRFSRSKPTVHPRFCPGSINCISQSGDTIVVSSCVDDGIAQDEDSTIPYNREGTLVLLRNNQPLILHGHERPRGEEQVSRGYPTKYYSAIEVAFDPANPENLVSCGEDGRTFLWNCTGTPEQSSRPLRTWCYGDPVSCIPRNLLFKPEGSIFAIGGSDGRVYSQNVNSQLINPLQVVRKDCRVNMQVQSIAWGTAQSSNWLFATSAPESKASHVGSHRAFDVTTNQLLFTLKNGDAGEDLAVDSTGKRLILATSNEEQVFVLETYDIRRNVGKPAQRVILPPLPRYNVEDTNMKSAINAVSFSPDGIYVAVARSDNVTHVYDSRFLGRDILYDFPHRPGTEGTVEDTKYGVVKLDWVEGPGSALSLVTGGADGCVRLWDLKRAKGPNDGTIIAQSDSYVSWFSLGDPHKNEKSIILGDGSGNLVINS